MGRVAVAAHAARVFFKLKTQGRRVLGDLNPAPLADASGIKPPKNDAAISAASAKGR
jgi:hypothetical protein